MLGGKMGAYFNISTFNASKLKVLQIAVSI